MRPQEATGLVKAIVSLAVPLAEEMSPQALKLNYAALNIWVSFFYITNKPQMIYLICHMNVCTL